jgi:hypothetical protein
VAVNAGTREKAGSGAGESNPNLIPIPK